MNKIEIKRLLAQSVSDQIMVLDAVRTADTKAHQDIRVFLTSRGTANTMSFVAKDQCCAVQKLQGDAVVDIRSNDLTSTATVPLTGTSPSFSVNGTECAAFSGCNAVIGHRNGESVESLAEWLQRLHEWHGMNAAIVIERQPPDMVEHAAVRLARALQDRGVAGLRIVLLCAESALGRLETGPEWHPFLAPDAPGKDRMRAPEPDPWTAPLGVSSIYEAIRARFLNTARAVLNLEVCDLVGPLGTRATDCEISETVFDRAVAAPEGYVTLSGRRVYPWSLSAKDESRFSDHICWRFDDMRLHRRWCVAPARLPDGAVWRQTRVFGAHETAARAPFWRCMALRYGVDPAKGQGQVSRIVPKSSLVECPPLLALSARLDAAPKRMPAMTLRSGWQRDGRIAVVSTMKNEGPFLLEWIAYHRSIGVQDFVIYTNDCDDGTDHFLQLLQNKGILQHRDNPYRAVNMKPQHAALAAAETEPLVQHASWLICMDVDEYINIHVGQGHLRDLIAAVPDANMISMTWRLFGNNDISSF
ncbi:MAG: glycosyltransferase family 2 protein, partial [Pseudomonadota bacterium]